jgi:DNA polymerase III subunit alpha
MLPAAETRDLSKMENQPSPCPRPEGEGNKPYFAQLRVHSWFSFLRGLASPQALVQAAAAQGCTALALTDHHNLTGAIEFYTACQDAGVQPILGLEVDVTPPEALSTAPTSTLALLAMDRPGWANLCRVASLLTGEADPLPFEQLVQDMSGLLCLSGGGRGAAARLLAAGQSRLASAYLQRLSEAFPERLYVELQQHTPEDAALVEGLAGLAARLGLPLVAAQDVHYLTPEQEDLQRLVTAMRLNLPLFESEQNISPAVVQAAAPPGAYFISPSEMASRFAAYPQALQSTQEIAARCILELPLGQAHYPAVPLPPGKTALDVLADKATAGAQRLYAAQLEAELPEPVRARLEHELHVIGETGYAALFLIMEDILTFARRQGVLFASRGSAASSLVAHCLGITTPDPIAHNLYFERFLNPVRHTPPDIDTDLCSRRREEVIRYVYDRFGHDRVATVCTINRMRRRSALRGVAKAYGLPAEEVGRLVGQLPQRWYSPAQRSHVDSEPYADLQAQFPGARYQAVFRDARALIGVPDHLSVHPGGMVISPEPITQLVPLQQAAKGVAITQFDLESIEKLGLVKIDLLGIRGLTVLADVVEAVSAQTPGKSPADVLEAIPNDDLAVSELLERGGTIGCFQIESPGMRATLREIHARCEADLLAALALYRPGPLTGGLKDAFVRRHRGLEEPEQLHPALHSLLEDTYGVILYQEQVLRIAHELAGLSLADADLLRRAMSHFDPGKQMITLQEKFQAGALARSGVPVETSQRIWELMAAFAGYGFPKAHAASYAQLGWRLAWCKVHYPALFMTAVLANWGGYYIQRVYLTEARRLGLTVRPPHVNYAKSEFSLSYVDGAPVLFMGLDQVRDLTRRVQVRIQSQQPFHSLADFLARVDPRPVEVENLIRVGALEGFGRIPDMLAQVAAGGWQGGQFSLFPPETGVGQDWDLNERVANQQALLGASLDAHPLELVADRVAAAGAISTQEAADRIGQRVRIAGVRHLWRRAFLGRGEAIYTMTLEDLDGMLDVVISDGVYRRSRAALAEQVPYLVEGVVELDPESSEPFIRTERISRL